MSVDEYVNAGRVGCDVGDAPRSGLFVDAQVAEHDDIVSAVRSGCIDCLLYSIVQILALIAFAEAVDVFAVSILEERRSGFVERFGGINAYESDLLALDLEDLVGIEQSFASLQIHEVAADVREFRQLIGDLAELVQTVVEFVVTRSRYVILDVVHDLGDVLALGQGADRAALDGVACIDQEICVLCHRDELVIALVAAMHVVRVQNDDIAGFCRRIGRSGFICRGLSVFGSRIDGIIRRCFGRFRGVCRCSYIFICECKAEGAQNQRERQQKRNEFAVTHFCPPLVISDIRDYSTRSARYSATFCAR